MHNDTKLMWVELKLLAVKQFQHTEQSFDPPPQPPHKKFVDLPMHNLIVQLKWKPLESCQI